MERGTLKASRKGNVLVRNLTRSSSQPMAYPGKNAMRENNANPASTPSQSASIKLGTDMPRGAFSLRKILIRHTEWRSRQHDSLALLPRSASEAATLQASEWFQIP